MKQRERNRHRVPTEELSQELFDIYSCVGKYPLHKLVPSGLLGSPGFSEEGACVRGDVGKHLSIRAGVRYDLHCKNWYCFVSIRDADDLDWDYNRPFTIEEWKKAVVLYNSLYFVDSDLLADFH